MQMSLLPRLRPTLPSPIPPLTSTSTSTSSSSSSSTSSSSTTSSIPQQPLSVQTPPLAQLPPPPPPLIPPPPPPGSGGPSVVTVTSSATPSIPPSLTTTTTTTATGTGTTSPETIGFPAPGLISTVTTTTTTATTTSAEESSASPKSGSGGDSGISPAAVVGISIALHVVVTVILVLVVRAYRNKYKRLKAQQQQQAGGEAVRGGGPSGGGGGRPPPPPPPVAAKRASPREVLKKRLSHSLHSSARLTQATDWIKLQDNVAATASSDASSSSPRRNVRDVRLGGALDRSLPPPPLATLPPHPSTPTTTTAATTQNRHNNMAAMTNDNSGRAPGGLNISDAAGAGMRLPSYRTSRSSAAYNQFLGGAGPGSRGRGGTGDDRSREEPVLSVWNDARWNEVLYRTLQEPPRSQAASVSQVSVSYYGDDEDDHGNTLPPQPSTAGSLRQMHSRRRLLGANDNINHSDDEEEVIQIGHRPEDVDDAGRSLDSPTMMVRDAVPPPLRPSMRAAMRPPPPPPAAFQSRWSVSS
ncbi:hypothetical protein PG985_003399 [Apiospora marii]|uniref:Uncharacterized protein n=1 Tax=Apiospora marii TaxID=335849 RepID=A0ABR1RVH0_9PEZI